MKRGDYMNISKFMSENKYTLLMSGCIVFAYMFGVSVGSGLRKPNVNIEIKIKQRKDETQ